MWTALFLCDGLFLAEFFSQMVRPAFCIESVIGILFLFPETVQRRKRKPYHRRQKYHRQIQPTQKARLNRVAVFMNQQRPVMPERMPVHKDEASHRSTAVSVPACDDCSSETVMLLFPEEKKAEHRKTYQILRKTPDNLKQKEKIFFHVISFCWACSSFLHT